jgi:hypothetical protein
VLWLLHYRRKNRETLAERAPAEEHFDAVTESLLGVPHEELVGEESDTAAGESSADHSAGNNNNNGHGKTAHDSKAHDSAR